ncbi:hypothetical protein C5D35_09520 [Rathayibacter toxicus]|nr:hypothetical protein C5D35_09520 [Rathayibacter toxicus]
MKPPGNPQGSRTLVAEAVAYGLGRLIGAPVPNNVLVEIPPSLRWDYASGEYLNGGVGHGSEHIEDVVVADDWGVYSQRDDNRRRQAFILTLWDLCMGVDPQWLHQVTADYSIWTFDHGFWLAGEVDWSIDSLRKIGTSPWQYDLDPSVASASALREAADRICHLSLATIQEVTGSVPLEWGTTSGEMSELASILFLRAEGVAARLRAAANQSRHS